MKWILNEPVLGDIIRVKVGSIYHYGIYVDDEKVVQFGLSPALRGDLESDKVEVCLSNIEMFLCGGFLEVGVSEKKDKKRNSPQITVETALSRIGEKGYNIIYNNCEHFAYECFSGEKYCSQTENVRNIFRNLSNIDVYIAEAPQVLVLKKLYPKNRQKEIENVPHIDKRREKYFVWKLLEYAINKSFGIRFKDVNFEKCKSGKWICDKCEFSLSHSDNVVCVAVSKIPIGVDIERIEIDKSRYLEKILTSCEKQKYENLSLDSRDVYLYNSWTKKESIFKAKNIETLSIEEFKMLEGPVYQEILNFGNKSFSLSVASKSVDNVRVYKVVDIF